MNKNKEMSQAAWIALVFLFLCIQSASAEGRRIKIMLRSGQELGGELLSVGEKSLVVIIINNVSDRELTDHPEFIAVVSKKDIKKVTLKAKSHVLAGMGIGLLVGTVGGGIISASDPKKRKNQDFGSALMEPIEGALSAAAGGLLGLLVGAAIGVPGPRADEEINVDSLQDLFLFRQYARYQENEPEFLKTLWAQEKKQDSLPVSSKIDTIATKADSSYTLYKGIYNETKNIPLKNKKFGIELKFFRLLLGKDFSLSGGFSFYNVNRHAELAFPIYYSNPKDPKYMKTVTIDCHYRYFLGNTQNGFYLSGFVRYAHLNGYSVDTGAFFLPGGQNIGVETRENKFGLGVGIGYRKFSKRGLYWGSSISLGRYLNGENDKFYEPGFEINNGQKKIVDWEFWKIGWAF
jgi:hypothetical protein